MAINKNFKIIFIYLYEIPPIKFRGSGAIPLNCAEEKSNPGCFKILCFLFSPNLYLLLLETFQVIIFFSLLPLKTHLIDYVL